MDALKRKMKFLATKLSALQSEVIVSREIFHAAHADVKNMDKPVDGPDGLPGSVRRRTYRFFIRII